MGLLFPMIPKKVPVLSPSFDIKLLLCFNDIRVTKEWILFLQIFAENKLIFQILAKNPRSLQF